MHWIAPVALEGKILVEAKRLSVSPQDLVSGLVATSLASVVVSTAPEASTDPSEKCLCPSCRDGVLSRGLCPRHYQRARWNIKRRKLDEGWLVRHGRLLPARGLSASHYAIPEETLGTLPSAPPDLADETLWMFGFPQAQSERERLSR